VQARQVQYPVIVVDYRRRLVVVVLEGLRGEMGCS